jgi:recombination protein RecA
MPKPKKPSPAGEAKGTAAVLSSIQRLAAASKRSEDGAIIDVCRSANTIQSASRYLLTTGIESIDHLIGGGIPFGKITEVYGVESSGKTALVMRSLIRGQLRKIVERDPETGELTPIGDNVDITLVFVDNEQSIENTERIMIEGVRVDCVLTRCDTVDQVFKIFDKTMEALAAVEKETKRKQLCIVVVDTIAGTASREELSMNWDKEDYPRGPKMLRRGFRILARRLQRQNIAAIFTNQVSGKFDATKKKGPMAGVVQPSDDDYSSPGGKALKFWSHCRIFLTRERDFKLQKGLRFPSGFVSYVCSTKNRSVPPGRFVRMCLLYSGGISDVYSILETLCTDKSYAERSTDGIALKLVQNGIEIKTFNDSGADAPTIDEDEDAEADGEEPVGKSVILKSVADWPEMYAKHPELHQLWEKFKESIFNCAAVVKYSDETIADEESAIEP